MSWAFPLIFFVVAFAACAGAIALLIPILRRKLIFDHPNERSLHLTPIPRGAGMAMIPVIVGLWVLAAAIEGIVPAEPMIVWIVLAALALCALSWIDDLFGLSPVVRFGFHVLAVVVLLAQTSDDVLYLHGLLPFWADRLVAGLFWIWFINLFNFMDGIDGLSGVETLCIGLGLIALAVVTPALWDIGLPAAILVGAALGFLLFNWAPAKIFLGDSGSVPLGLLLGWLLLNLSAAGFWAAAIILPFYYLADATVTLLRRLVRGEKIWQAHRQHFYQQAVTRGLSHDRVVRMIAFANVALIVFALLTLYDVLAALAGAGLVILLLLAVLQGRTANP